MVHPMPEFQEPFDGPPTTGKTQMHIWLEPDTAEWLRVRAHHLRVSRSKAIEQIVQAVKLASISGSPTMNVP